MVISDRTKGCCSSDLNEPPHPNHDQFAELDAHNSLRPGKPPFQPNLDRPGASAAEGYNRIDAARLEKTSCLRHAVLRSIPCLSAISTCRPRPIIRTRRCSGGCS